MWPYPNLPEGKTPPSHMVPVRPGIAAENQARDRARLAGACAVGENGEELPLLNRVVYDSVTPPEPSSEGKQQPLSSSSSWKEAVAAASRSAGGVGTAGPASPARGFGVTGVVPSLEPWYHPSGPHDDTLCFESRFESGNLRRAIQVCVALTHTHTHTHTHMYIHRHMHMRM